MKLFRLFALFALSEIVNGSWWATAAQPVLVTIGTLFAALGSD